MTSMGIVTASSLNFRSSPDGDILKSLPKGTSVEILEDQGKWLKVRADGEEGFVSGRYIQRRQKEAEQPGVKTEVPPSVSGTFRFIGNDAVGPGDTPFARKFRRGVFNYGKTSIGEFVRNNRDRFPQLAPSQLRVMEAVSENEGKLEAINTWDNSFLTFGVFQWTAGVGNSAGELPALLNRLKQVDESVFDQYFGQFGLDVCGIKSAPGHPPRGFFSLNGTPLNTREQKKQLRTLEWAYRFWRAGSNDTVRHVQIEHAISRAGLFYRNPKKKIGDHFVADYVTSEYGVALLLDQHVNRPGHVPGTIAKAVAELVKELGADRPEEWTDEEEKKLVDIYVRLRAKTGMTDSDKRADTVRKAVAAGLASDRRGSYRA